MYIKSAQVDLRHQHQFERSEERSQIQLQRLRRGPGPASGSETANPATTVELFEFTRPSVASLARIEARAEQTLATINLTTSLLKALVESMTGKSIDDAPIINSSSTERSTSPPIEINSEPVNSATSSVNTINFESITLASTYIQEYEYSNVNIGALIENSDGSHFEINLTVTMERHFQQKTTELTLQTGQLTDPLVINFNGASAKLSSDLVEFDLNSDGINELLPSLVSDSAYIALDKNGDGIINNGSELFGPDSGNGFAELALYDEDGNGFIDENDSVFSQLVAFRPSDEASGNLKTLHQDMNIGAIFLGAINSPFRLTDSNNNTLGQIRSSSFYIDNQQRAGSLQQVDLIV